MPGIRDDAIRAPEGDNGGRETTRENGMRLGVSLNMDGPWTATARTFIDGMCNAEAVGFHGIWFFDTVGRGTFRVDPLSALAAAAAVTERVELGTCILRELYGIVDSAPAVRHPPGRHIHAEPACRASRGIQQPAQRQGVATRAGANTRGVCALFA